MIEPVWLCCCEMSLTVHSLCTSFGTSKPVRNGHMICDIVDHLLAGFSNIIDIYPTHLTISDLISISNTKVFSMC